MKKPLFTKKVWPVVLVIGLLLIAGVAILYRQIPALLENRIRSELAVYGVDTFSLGQPYWGLSGAGTTALRISGHYDNWLFDIHIDALQADYHWRTLLDGEIHSLSVARINIRVVEDGVSKKATAEPLNPEALVKILNELNIPVEEVAIERASLGVQWPGGGATLVADDLSFDNSARDFRGHFELRGEGEDLGGLPSVRLEVPGAAIEAEGSAAIDWLPALAFFVADADGEFFRGNLSLQKPSAADSDAYRLLFDAAIDHANMATLLSTIPGIRPDVLDSRGIGSEEKLPIIAANVALQGSVNVPEQIDLSHKGWWQQINAEAALDGRIHLQNLPQLDLVGSQSASASFALRLFAAAGIWSLTMEKPAMLESQLQTAAFADVAAQLGWSGAVPVNLSVNMTAPGQFNVTPDSWLFQSPALDMNLAIGEPGQALSAEMVINNLRIDKQTEAQLFGIIRAPYAGKQLPPLRFTAVLSQQQDNIAASGNFDVDDWQLEGDFRVAVAESIVVGGSASFASLATIIASADRLGLYDGDLELVAGKATMKFSATAAPQQKNSEEGAMALGFKVDVDATHIAGLAKGLAFDGVNIRGGVARKDLWRSTAPFEVRAGRVSSGVELTDLFAKIRLKPSRALSSSHWSVDSFSARLFSGTVKLAEPAAIDVPFAGNTLTIELSKLKLEDILALYAKQGVEGTGAISGKIPLVLGSEGLSISDGSLESIETGTIRFANAKAAALGSSNEQLAMTMRLLENFSYDRLRVTTNFEPSGKMLLGVQLSGRNPAEFDGRQINFNINLEENIYDLFKVLRLTDDMTKKLEKRLQQ